MLIYSAVTMLLMVAASAALSFNSVSVMAKAPATQLIMERRRRRARVWQSPGHMKGDPYRTPPREYVQERLDQVAAAAARYVGFKVDRPWVENLKLEPMLRWAGLNLVRVVIDAMAIGLVLPLLPGVQFTGTASTALALGALYGLCLLGYMLLLVLIFVLVKVCSNTPLEVVGLMALLLGMLATPWAVLKAVDLFADSFNMTGVLGTMLAGLVMAVVRSLGGSKKKNEHADERG